MHKTRADKVCEVLRYCFLIFIMIALFFPFVFMLMNSFKSEGAFVANKWLPEFVDVRFENYAEAFQGVWRYLFNSVYLAVVIAFGTVIVASITAYVFSTYEFPFKKVLFAMIIMVMMIPGILTFIPQFIIVKNLGLYDSHFALILPGIAGGQIFTIFVLKSFFDQIPSDVIESAKIDGAVDLRIIGSIVLPLSLPMLTTMLVLAILGQWNSYLWPLVTLSSKNKWTVPIGIRFLSEQGNVRTTVQYAAYTIVSLPLILLFAFTMDKFVQGLSSGAIKG